MVSTVSKVLAAQEDLAIGVGTVVQSRQGNNLTVKQIELAFIFRTVAEIRALDVTKYTRVQLHTNGPALEYLYNSVSTAVDDDFNTLLPDSAPIAGRWLLALNKALNVKQLGALGDSTTDDSAAVQAANVAVAGGDLYFPSGTYTVEGLTDIKGKWILAKDAIIKHKSASILSCISAVEDFTIEGGTLDGNKDNQTARVWMVQFAGDNLAVRHSTIKDTVAVGIQVDDADTVNIHNNIFTGMAEHTGVAGGTASAIRIDEAPSLAKVHIKDNFFLNDAPSNVTLAPTAIQISTTNSTANDAVITGNTIVGFGTTFTANVTGAIEIYRGVDRIVIANNTIYDAYSYGIRVNDADAVSISDNTVFVKSNVATGLSAISVIAYNHGTTLKSDVIISGNIVSNPLGFGMYVAGSPSQLLVRANVSDNLVIDSSQWGIYFAYCGGEIVGSNNILQDCGTYGYRIESSSGSLLLSGGSVDNPTTSGVYARTAVTGLDITVDGVHVSNSGNLGISVRDVNSVIVQNCIDVGSTEPFDTTETTGYVINNSWQQSKNKQAKTASYSLTTHDIGKIFTNEGALGAIEATLPSVSTLMEGYTVTFIILAAQQFDIDPNNADQIFPTTNAAGDRLRNVGVIGDRVTLEYTHANGWSELNKVGTWTDVN